MSMDVNEEALWSYWLKAYGATINDSAGDLDFWLQKLPTEMQTYSVFAAIALGLGYEKLAEFCLNKLGNSQHLETEGKANGAPMLFAWALAKAELSQEQHVTSSVQSSRTSKVKI